MTTSNHSHKAWTDKGGHVTGAQQQLGRLHDRAGREGGLMAAGAALIALEPPAINEPMLMPVAAWTAEPIGPARLLQGSLTSLLGAVKPLEFRQREAFLELDGTARHDTTGIYVPVYAATKGGRRGASWVIKRIIDKLTEAS